MLKSKLLSATAAAGELLAIEDVFSTYLYTGNSSTQTITNGIDLAGEGGLVWTKTRSAVRNHYLTDTEIGPNNVLSTDSSDPTINFGSIGFTSFNSDGFTVGSSSVANSLSDTIASWTFRKAPRFFDVVTYTGTGSARNIAHNLGVEPGCIIIKSLSSSVCPWVVYHRSVGNTQVLNLNNTNAASSASNIYFNSTSPTQNEFTLGTYSCANSSGIDYVAYLFAHDPLGPSGDGSDGLIACGSYIGNTTTKPNINLGWEPQWVLIKAADGAAAAAQNWALFDSMRGFTMGNDARLQPNTSDAEVSYDDINPTPTGFTIGVGGTRVNESGSTYIYIAIRRGPMREPTSGTEVFAPLSEVGTGSSRTVNAGFPVDTFFIKDRTGLTGPTNGGNILYDRLRGNSNVLQTQSTAAEAVNATYTALFNSVQNGIVVSETWSAYGYREYVFRRAPGFFDVVAYTGDGVAGRTVSHNLGVAPEMMWVKGRTIAQNWAVYNPNGRLQLLNQSGAEYSAAVTDDYFGDGSTVIAPTQTQFTIGTASPINSSGASYIAYLFATLPGISKIGSYTGNGSSQTINCGFTGGARFILIKRTDSTGDWYVWDTARGIVSGNDPHLSLNTTAAEVTSDDTIDPDSSGFIVNQVSATNVNVSSASYIYLAIA
jgi:hypothetical protein